MSVNDSFERALEKIKNDQWNEVNILDLMEVDSKEAFNKWFKDWCVDRADVEVCVRSPTYDFYYQYGSPGNDDSKSQFKRLDTAVKSYLDLIIDKIKPYCKRGLPVVTGNPRMEQNINSMTVLFKYKIAINKHDLNYIKIKKPDVYHKLSGYTIDKPLRVG